MHHHTSCYSTTTNNSCSPCTQWLLSTQSLHHLNSVPVCVCGERAVRLAEAAALAAAPNEEVPPVGNKRIAQGCVYSHTCLAAACIAPVCVCVPTCGAACLIALRGADPKSSSARCIKAGLSEASCCAESAHMCLFIWLPACLSVCQKCGSCMLLRPRACEHATRYVRLAQQPVACAAALW